MLRAALPIALGAALWCGCSDRKPTEVIDGQARFQPLSPSLVRLEYAADGHFEDGLSFNRRATRGAPPAFATRIRDGWRELETSELLLRYRRGSGPFAKDNVTVQLRAGAAAPISPFAAPPAQPIGGWLRSLDGVSAAVPLNRGLLARDGWAFVDDSTTALVESDGWTQSRPTRSGPYRDGYLFAYGSDYARALADLATLSGPPPLLPRWAFGIWFSRYFPYADADYRTQLLPQFRADQLPLDVLVVDTDWKSPDNGDGWSWNQTLFPDGQSFFDWAASQGLHLSFNIHPAINEADPLFAATNAAAGGLSPIGGGDHVWDWGLRRHDNSYFALHAPYDGARNGVRLWWLDWCCEAGVANVTTPPLPDLGPPTGDGGAPTSAVPSVITPDAWINELYAQRATARGLRGFAFSRIGGFFDGYGNVTPVGGSGPWADHRSAIHFTGDSQPTWDMLAFEIAFTAAEASIGVPYVTHDIGSFYGVHLPEDLYVRWVQLGAMQPIFRLHSNHGDRLPWDYSDATRAIAEDFMRLRESLVPYLYTLGRAAYDSGMPMVRGLHFAYPLEDAAYSHTHEYLLGPSLLVAPIASADGTTTLWFPPGLWTHVLTGEQVTGPLEQTVSAPLDSMPLYAAAGAIIPRQPPMRFVGDRPVDPLRLDVYPGADGDFTLYEDEGEGLGYLAGASASTPIQYVDRQQTLTIGAARGRYPGQPAARGYELHWRAASPPASVLVDGKPIATTAAAGADRWSYDPASRSIVVQLASRAIDARVVVGLK